MNKRDFSFVRRMVIKVGTSLLRKSDTEADIACLRAIAVEIAEVRKRLKSPQIVLVSSGAVGFGMIQLGLTRRPSGLATLQAAAAIGQPQLMRAWAEAFLPHGIQVSQLLLTNDGLQERARFLNAKNALARILDLHVIPIVNENDTVAVEELTFGDNDMLSALVAAMIDADLLINLTDVDGFYDPTDSRRAVLHTVRTIRREWLAQAGATGGFTIGGMAAKLKAAGVALRSGIPVVIANGRAKNPVTSVLDGRTTGTLFLPKDGGLKGKKIWLSFFPAASGKIVVDSGASKAISRGGKSLLASGIVKAVGHFLKKNCVSVVTVDGREIARGISFYSAAEITLIAGCPSSSIREKLNLSDQDDFQPEVIHRDELALIS